MKILIIGDQHVGGYGLSAGQLSFIGHFVRLIRQTGHTVSVEAYAHSTLSAIRLMLSQLPLEQYDLVIIQAGKGCLDHPAGNGALWIHDSGQYADLSGDLVLPACLQLPVEQRLEKKAGWLSKAAYLLYVKTMARFGQLPRVHTVKQEMKALLTLLKPYRHKVLMLSPFTHRDPIVRWLRQEGRALFLQEDVRQMFSVMDSDTVIQSREEYFLPTDEGYLNAVGHELVGHALFDFYLAAPTVVAIHSIRRS